MLLYLSYNQIFVLIGEQPKNHGTHTLNKKYKYIVKKKLNTGIDG